MTGIRKASGPASRWGILALVAAALVCGAQAVRAAEAQDPLQATIAKLPAQTDAEAEAVFKELMAGAPDTLVKLTQLLQVPGTGDDTKVRFALHGLAMYVYRPGADAERKAFAEALTKQLGAQLAPAVKGFLIRQLQLAGGPEAIETIGKFLTNDELCEYAAQALLAMKDKAVIPQFLAALPNAQGACRLTIIQDLGVLRAAKGVPAVLAALKDENRDLRLTAAFALANSADPAAADPLFKGAAVEAAYESSQMTDAALLLARTLGQAGDKRTAERICRGFLKPEAEIPVRCAALMALATALGADAMDDVLAAMSSEDPDLQAAGIEAAIAMPGEAATQRWVDRMQKANPAGRVAILDLLARRRDSAALPAVLQATKDENEQVRLAAFKATGAVGNEGAVPTLVAALATDKPAEKVAAQNALLQIPGSAASAAVAKALPAASPDIKAVLLDVLAGRKGKDQLDVIVGYTTDQDPKVAAAAISALGKLAEAKDLAPLTRLLVQAKDDGVRGAAEKALANATSRVADKDQCVGLLAAALKGAQGPARASLLRVLGGIGNQKAFEAVRAGLSDEDEQAVDAAIRALSDWRDPSPTADLLRIAQTAAKPVHQVLALRGYVRMIALSKAGPEESLKMCQAAMAAAKRPEDKVLVLSALGQVPTPDALAMAEAALADPALKNEAAMAVISIARGISGGNADVAKGAIAKAVAASNTDAVKKAATDATAFIERNEDFVTTWLASGPYPGGNTKTPHPPEDPNAKDVKWKIVTAAGDVPGFIDLNKELGNVGNCSGYLKAQILSPKDQEALLEAGSDDGIKIWLNGQVVHDKDVPRSFVANEDKVKIALKEGWNPLLVKVAQGGGDWSCAVRIRAADGSKLQGIRLKVE